LEDIDSKGNTPLRLAAQSHESKRIGLLLELGALPDVVALQDIKNTPPLNQEAKASAEIIAKALLLTRVSDGTAGSVRAILDSAKDCNVVEVELLKCVNTQGQTPLQLAASKKSQADVVRLLLDRGASVDQKNTTTGDTALHEAARAGCDEIVRELLQQGKADFRVLNSQKQTPVQSAEATRQTATVTILKDWADPSIWYYKEVVSKGMRLRLEGVADVDPSKCAKCDCDQNGKLTIQVEGAPLQNLGDGQVDSPKRSRPCEGCR
jgi:ankyrin repeat protein